MIDFSYSKEVPPSAAKRQGSPSSLASEEKLPKRRHFSNDGCQTLDGGKIFNEKVHSEVSARSEVVANNIPREVSLIFVDHNINVNIHS